MKKFMLSFVNLNRWLGPFIGLSAIMYFSYHSLRGDRGIFSWWKFKDQILIAKHNLELTRKKKQKLELRVRLLHPENLDPDMLEERVRIMLNYGYPNEFIILDSKNIQSLDPKKLRPQN